MTKEQIFELMTGNPVFFLATVENGEPRVRGMSLYKADETGIVFHTGAMKELYKQIIANPNVQMCFNDMAKGIQVRVRGILEEIWDTNLKDEIVNHPTRAFLKKLRENSSDENFYDSIRVFKMKNGIANVWTFDTNFASKEDIRL